MKVHSSPPERILEALRGAQVSPACRGYALLLWERWGRNGRPCFESQERLAKHYGVTVRSIGRWEEALRAAGVWTRSETGRSRILAFLVPEHRTEASGISGPNTGQACPRTPDNGYLKPDARDSESGPACPPTARNERTATGSVSGSAAESSGAELGSLFVERLLVQVDDLGLLARPARERLRGVLVDRLRELRSECEQPRVALQRALEALLRAAKKPGIENPTGCLIDAVAGNNASRLEVAIQVEVKRQRKEASRERSYHKSREEELHPRTTPRPNLMELFRAKRKSRWSNGSMAAQGPVVSTTG